MNKAEYKAIKKELDIIVRGVELYAKDIERALKNETVESLYDVIKGKVDEMRELREFVEENTLVAINGLVKK